MEVFTDMVSLGYRCRGTRRFRDHFRTESAYPFDWWVSPMKGLRRVLHDWDVDRLFDPAELSEVMAGDEIAYIAHEGYGLKYQHDFPLENGRIRPGWRDHLDAAKSRTRHLMDKFDALNRPDRRILFYRELGPQDRDAESAARGLKTEVRAHIPDAKCAFLLVSREGVQVNGWRTLKIDDATEEPWTGDPAIWDAALSSLGYALQPPAEAAPERRSA